jgi:catechol 2,3-dioxygenase-like lactoylglutathione lyase family enzyme
MTGGAHRPSHVGLCVTDIERSLRFYRDGLGFALSDGFDLDSEAMPGLDEALEVPGRVVLRSQLIELEGMRIELLHWTTPGVDGTPSDRRNRVGLTHLSFWVDDVDAAAARLVEHGGTIIESTRTAPGIELVFLEDPDGTRVELMAVPKAAEPA